VQQLEHFSPLKKFLQYVGSGVVRWASGTDVPDTVSGFRALSREAALRTFVTSDFSYTIEVLIQAGKRKLAIQHVPIRTNIVTRESRLFTNNWNFIKRQAATIARTYATYEPLKSFSYLASPFLLIGVTLGWLQPTTKRWRWGAPPSSSASSSFCLASSLIASAASVVSKKKCSTACAKPKSTVSHPATSPNRHTKSRQAGHNPTWRLCTAFMMDCYQPPLGARCALGVAAHCPCRVP
jgi:hypothetical protein